MRNETFYVNFQLNFSEMKFFEMHLPHFYYLIINESKFNICTSIFKLIIK